MRWAARMQSSAADVGAGEARLKQLNLTGSAGFISMEDGAVGGFVQHGIAGTDEQEAVLEMGGASIETQQNRTTEASVRGF
jgi:hypothetical protein